MTRRKTLIEYMRMLHRDIGFFVVGLTIIYSLSGIVLVYRTTDFLKFETAVAQTLHKNLEPEQVAKALKLRELQVSKTEGDLVYFSSGKTIANGRYDKTTGIASYTEKQLPAVLNKFNQLHKSSNSSVAHWFSVGYGILLTFLAVSAFWMYRPGTPLLRRGIYLAAAGIGVSAMALILV